MTCGWHGSIDDLMKVSGEELISAIIDFYRKSTGENPASTQTGAWADSLSCLREQFEILRDMLPGSGQWALAFEYELPREGGRRPDLVVLARNRIVVLEFKQKHTIEQADIDQVVAYARDLENYHEASHGHTVLPVLVPTKKDGEVECLFDVTVVPPRRIAEFFAGLPVSNEPEIHLPTWLASDYSPLPTLVEAARRIFRDEPLPQIKRAASAGVDKTIDYLLSVAKKAKSAGERHLALVTGVPGAGKTLVGLKFVHEHHFDEPGWGANSAVFLSGNGPLVEVLQDALGSKVFVQAMRNFIKQYGLRKATPREHVLVFDEAQRAWDLNQVREHHKVSRLSEDLRSEPGMLVEIAERLRGWALVVGLIGEGQEIWVGEEGGLEQWNTAIRESRLPWIVHGPTYLASEFGAASRYVSEDLLNLTSSLRTHLAEDVQKWIGRLLNGELPGLRTLADRIHAQGFRMYLTTSIDRAKDYVQKRYSGEPHKRYGLLASSRAGDMKKFGVCNRDRLFRKAAWYNAPPESPYSSCAMHLVASEFESQGLELDLPIICWGNDLYWSESEWKTKPYTGKRPLKDPHRIRLNSYRVLLSRGRDGFIIFAPPTKELEETVRVLHDAGVRPLPDASR